MKDIITNIVDAIKIMAVNNGPIISLIVGFFVIVLESIIPILPLSVFIAINILIFGNIYGYLLSLVATISGCTLSFFLFRKGFRTLFYKKIENKENIKDLIKKIDKLDFSSLVLIIAMPFTPAFLVNIASALSKMTYKKFLLALLIGKAIMVYFWGFVGSTFIESFSDLNTLIELTIFMLLAYILSKLINKKFNIG